MQKSALPPTLPIFEASLPISVLKVGHLLRLETVELTRLELCIL